MLYIFHGPDYYRRQKAVFHLKEMALKKYPLLSVGRFFLEEEGEVEKLLDFISSGGLFEKGKRVAIISGFFSLEKETFFEKIFSAFSSKEILFILNEEQKLDKHLEKFKKDFEKISPPPQIHSFDFLGSSQLINFLSKEALSLGIKIEPAAVRFLVDLLKMDTGGLINEIKKLSFLANPITFSFLKSLNWYSQNFSVFDFARLLNGSSSLEKRLFLWESLLFQKVDLNFVFNYLAKASLKKDLVNLLALADKKVKLGLLSFDQAVLEVLLN